MQLTIKSYIEPEILYKSLIEESEDLILLTNLEMEIIYANKACVLFSNLEDVSSFKMRYAALSDIFPEADQKLGNFFDKTNHDRVIKIQRHDNRVVYLEGHSFQVKLGDDYGNLLIFRDVTTKELNVQQLIQVSKLESIGVLAGGVAHDFNNILAGIVNNLDLATLKMETIKPMSEVCSVHLHLIAQVVKNLNSSKNVALKARVLIEKLLSFSKEEKPVKKLLDITKLVCDTTEFALVGSRLSPVFDIDRDLWVIEADEIQLLQVINNLVINANQAMETKPEEKNISVSIKNCFLEADLSKPWIVPGNYVSISVEDFGVGIPEENLLKVFDPYFTTKQKGTGLGLAVVSSVMRSHNGFYMVDSKVNKGSIFTVYFPAETKELSVDDNHVRILIVDDDAKIRESLSQLLNVLNYGVFASKSGEEAIKILEQHPNFFNVIITDLTMPGGMTGVDFVKSVKKLDSKLKVILMTGHSDSSVLVNYDQYGFKGAMLKPFDVDTLSSVLRRVLNGDRHGSGKKEGV